MVRKYIFVVGGVMSGVGKGVAASSIARLLKDSGYKVTAFKIDPYINVDAGTMNPTEHGEVFVLDDGTECDQDMGNYERFLETSLSGSNYMTTGSIYRTVIAKERNLEYNGKCVEVVPHIPMEIIEKINGAISKTKSEIGVIEIGGTVGEYQNVLFLEAVRMLKLRHPNDVALMLVSYLPLLNKDNELKTKPTQYAVHTLNAAGLQPDMILGRAAYPLDEKRKEKIAFNCNMRPNRIISAPDVGNIYQIPVNFKNEKVDSLVLDVLSLRRRANQFGAWRSWLARTAHPTRTVTIGVVGKYFSSGSFVLADSYVSVIESLKHAAAANRAQIALEWLDSKQFDHTAVGESKAMENCASLSRYDGIVVPGGFGSRWIEGKINAIQYARENKIPYLGLCYGMQLAVVEFARSVIGLPGAHTTEVNPKTDFPVVDILPEQKEMISQKNYGGTMRLGVYPAVLAKGTIAYDAYRTAQRLISKKSSSSITIHERHRHRYEINPDYLKAISDSGMIISGISPSGRLAEIVELPREAHPFFVGTQFHPEFQSWPLDPHPLFKSFIEAAGKIRR